MNGIDETYRIERTLATGGTAVLFKAVQVSLDRPVVVKRLHAHLAAEPGFAERFETEAKAAARLDHGNIVRIIDFGRDDAGHYIVMEYVDGPSLKEVLAARSVLGDDLALLVAREICLGLDHAHRRGVVHRDIKPANIMIGLDGRVVITDFGLAKLHRPEAQQTLASTLLGTPLYMSPEQAAGEAIDGRSDLFSLGTICYEALTGAQPFFGDTYAAVIRKILNGVSTGPKRLRSDVRPDTDAIVMKALALDPAKRFRDAAGMAGAIEAALDPKTVASARERLRFLACGEDAAPRRVQRRHGTRRASSAPRVAAIITGAAALFVLAAVRTGFLGALPQSIRAGFPDPAPPRHEAIPASIGEPLPGITMTPIDEPVPIAAESGASAAAEVAPAADVPIPPGASADTADGAASDSGRDAARGVDIPFPVAVSSGENPPAAAPLPAEPRPAPEPPEPRAETGFLDIAVEPVASIIVDGEPQTASGRISMLELPAGPHEIVCRRDGYRDYVETVRVAKGELSRRRVVLAEIVGSLVVKSESGARLFVDGAYRGELPLEQPVPLAPGPHRVELKKPGYRSWSAEVHVPDGEPLKLAIRLVPLSESQ